MSPAEWSTASSTLSAQMSCAWACSSSILSSGSVLLLAVSIGCAG